MKFSTLFITITVVLLSISSTTFAGSSGEKDKLKLLDKIKYTSASSDLSHGEFVKATREFKKLLEKYPENAKVNYKVGECYLAMQEYDKAIQYLNKAKIIDYYVHKNLVFHIGRSYQLTKDFDKALEIYKEFQDSLSIKDKTGYYGELVADYIEQCNFVKDQQANPVDVKIKNIGSNINSEYKDTHPSVSADGSTLIFTSTRAESEGGLIDPITNSYYEDIFISTWDPVKNEWSIAEGIPGSINKDGHDANMSISPDGTQIFIYKNINGGDIYTSKLKYSGRWSSPKPLEKPINTSYYESDACLSADGNTLYFVSNNTKTSMGAADIFVTHKLPSGEWEKPVNLGAPINTFGDEIGVFIHPDGKTLFFSSDGHLSIGSYDVFMSVYDEKTKTWSKPINLGAPINTPEADAHFSLSTDYKTGYYTSVRPGGMGQHDIYEIDMSNFFNSNKKANEIVKKDQRKAISILKGKVIDTETGKGVKATVKIFDKVTKEMIGTTTADNNGEYFITLEANKTYEVIVNKNTYKELIEDVLIPEPKDKTNTVVKSFTIEKFR